MLIGKTITVMEAKNVSIKGKTGLVIDETKHTFTIRTTNNQRRTSNNEQTNKQHHDITIIKDQIITIEETP